ncbi:MAG: site-specific integrase [Clostridia bacterium]|nr:site-specific integrase [Clostridia bacterium]
MRGHIRKYKDRWAAIVYLGRDSNGKEQRKWLYNKDKKELEKQMTEFIYKHEKGLTSKNDSIIFKDWFHSYKEMRANLKNLSEDTLRDYDTIFNNYLLPIHDKKLVDIKVSDIQKIYNTVLKNKGAKRVKKVHQVLSVFITAAYKQQYIERNLMDFVEMPAVEKYTPTIVDDDQFKHVVEKIKGTYLEALVIICAGLGLRLGEALGIQIHKCINFDTNILRVQQQLKRKKGGHPILTAKLKTDSSRRDISLPPDVSSFLKDYIEKLEVQKKMYEEYTGQPYHDNDLLICKDNGDPKPHTTVERNWRELFEDNKAPFRIHDLRHYNAILMLKNGVPDKVARDRLGHTTLQMTDRYQHTTKEIDQENAKKIKLF